MVFYRWGKVNKFFDELNEEERLGFYEVFAVVTLIGFSAIVAKFRVAPGDKYIEEEKDHKENTCGSARCKKKCQKELRSI